MTDTVQPIVPVMVSDWRDRRMAELEEQLEQAQAEKAAWKAEIARLKQRRAELERAAKRQARPFARDEHKAEPKRPGRKAGQGLFSSRAHPTPDEVDETKEARLDRCPECDGPLRPGGQGRAAGGAGVTRAKTDALAGGLRRASGRNRAPVGEVD